VVCYHNILTTTNSIGLTNGGSLSVFGGFWFHKSIYWMDLDLDNTHNTSVCAKSTDAVIRDMLIIILVLIQVCYLKLVLS
jgi:hypothetical protein